MRAAFIVVLTSLSCAALASCHKQPRDKPVPPPAPVVPPPGPTSPPPELTLASEPELPDEHLVPDGMLLTYSRSSIAVDGAVVTDLAAQLAKVHQLNARLAALSQQPQSTVATLLIDRSIRFEALAPGLAALSNLGHSAVRLVVATRTDRGFLLLGFANLDAPMMPPTRVITIHAASWQIQTPGPTKPALLDGHDRDQLRSALGDTPGPMHLIVDPEIPFQVVADTLTAITRGADGSVVRVVLLMNAP